MLVGYHSMICWLAITAATTATWGAYHPVAFRATLHSVSLRAQMAEAAAHHPDSPYGGEAIRQGYTSSHLSPVLWFCHLDRQTGIKNMSLAYGFGWGWEMAVRPTKAARKALRCSMRSGRQFLLLLSVASALKRHGREA